ncbi:MAG: nucleotidyltransferase family protein [Clostridiales bacterium]|nr:nucleotidyltransferase family protein [Clostridiales bacterium]
MIKLCRSYLNGEKLSLPENVDEHRLFSLARSQNLASVCHCALKRKMKLDKVDSFGGNFLDGVYFYQLQEKCFSQIKELLAQSDIPYIAFKGAALRPLYPVPESRLMSDIDIIIKEEHRLDVKNLLCSNGFECTASNGPVYKYEKDRVVCEVHTQINGEYSHGCFENPFEYAEFDGCEGTLDSSFHLACLIAHAAHHFRFYGVGVKAILDIAVMIKNGGANIDKALEYAKTVDLEKFGKVMLGVCCKWFGIGIDYPDDTEETEEFLLRGGAFGFKNTSGTALARKDLEEGKRISPLISKIRLAFPSYSRLRKIDYIRFIDGRPWLMPYAWVYRFIYNFKHKKNFVAEAVNSLGSDETMLSAQRQLEFFEEVGLYGN